MRSSVLLILLLGVFSVPKTCSGAISVSMDMNTTLAGIQSDALVLNGQTIDVDVVITLTEATTLGAYDFSVLIDDSEVNFVSVLETPPALFSGQNAGDPELGNFAGTTPGGGPFQLLNRIEAGSLLDNIAAGEYRVATIRLEIGNALNDGFIDLLPGIHDPTWNLFIAANGSSLNDQVVFNGGTITAVPEPGTWAFLGLAATGVVLRRLRVRKSIVRLANEGC